MLHEDSIVMEGSHSAPEDIRTVPMSLWAFWKTSTTQCRCLNEILPGQLTHERKMRQGVCNTGSWLLRTWVSWRTERRHRCSKLGPVLCQEAIASAEAMWHALTGCRSDAMSKAGARQLLFVPNLLRQQCLGDPRCC